MLLTVTYTLEGLQTVLIGAEEPEEEEMELMLIVQVQEALQGLIQAQAEAVVITLVETVEVVI